MLGSRLERGQTFSVPHSPTGITGAFVIAASRAAPQRPFSSGSKNAGPRGIVPCGIIATRCPSSSTSAAARSGSSDPVPRSTRIPPIASMIGPTTGASNTSFLPRKRGERPRRAIVSDIAVPSK
jgi:hypothetical protein